MYLYIILTVSLYMFHSESCLHELTASDCVDDPNDDPNCAMLRHDNFERRNQVQKSIKNQMNVVRERRS